MRPQTWAALCAFMASCWHRPIDPIEQAAGLKLLGALPDEAVENAVSLLAESGRESMPSWSVLYKAASDLRANSQLALADQDLTREPTPEERERFKRRWPEITAKLRAIAEKQSIAGHASGRRRLEVSGGPRRRRPLAVSDGNSQEVKERE